MGAPADELFEAKIADTTTASAPDARPRRAARPLWAAAVMIQPGRFRRRALWARRSGR